MSLLYVPAVNVHADDVHLQLLRQFQQFLQAGGGHIVLLGSVVMQVSRPDSNRTAASILCDEMYFGKQVRP